MKRRIASATIAVTLLACFTVVSISTPASSIIPRKGLKKQEIALLESDIPGLESFLDQSGGRIENNAPLDTAGLSQDNIIQDGIMQDSIMQDNTMQANAIQDDASKDKQALSEVNSQMADRNADISRGGAGDSNVRASYPVFAAATVLKKGMRGDRIESLQSDLKKLGYFNVEPTGYYGDITEKAVRKLQADYSITVDGIAGNQTFDLIEKLLSGNNVPAKAKEANTASDAGEAGSRGSSERTDYLVPWYNGVDKIFSIGTTATVFDIDTGLSFRIKRSYGYNHADCETLSAADTATMKKIYGGQWSWNRRAVIITVNGTRIAASMAGMPHAGNDSAPANVQTKWRSGGYGAGINLDTVKGNNMDGHFDVHFLGSKTHETNRVDEAHQSMVKKAAEWAARNF